MTKYIAKQKRNERTNLQRAVLTMLTTGMVAWPSFSHVYAASDFAGHNGRINTNGNVHDIYAGTKVNNAVGANKFTNFNVGQGDIANMHFNRYSQGDAFHTLLNFVQNRINVNGTVNALRNNKIGGNLYFISSNGMIVGQNGAINAGSLNVMTPTQSYYDSITANLATGGAAFLQDVQGGNVPLNPSGSIVVNGTVRTSVGANFSAPNIVIGKEVNADGSVNTAGADYTAKIKTGVDFSSIVNVENITDGNCGILTATKDANGNVVLKDAAGLTGNGEILLNAKADTVNKASANELASAIFGTTANTVSTNIYIGKDATLESLGNVSLSAVSTNKKTGDNSNELSLFALTEANIDVEGKVKAGGNVNIVAKAVTEHSAADGGILLTALGSDTVKWTEVGKALDAIFNKGATSGDPNNTNFGNNVSKVQDFLNNVQLGFAMVNSQANITIGKDAVVNSTGNINLSATSTANAKMDYTLPSISIDKIVRFSWENVDNESNINVQGKLTAEKGSVDIIADAKNDTIVKTVVPARPVLGGSMAFNLLKQENEANISIGQADNNELLVKGKDVNIKGNSTYSTDVSAILVADLIPMPSTAINWTDVNAYALTDIYADIDASGNIVVENNSTAKKFSVNSNNGMNRIEAMAGGILGNTSGTVDPSKTGNNISEFMNDVFKKMKNDTNKIEDIVENEGYVIEPTQPSDKTWAKIVNSGSSLSLVNMDNIAKMNIHNTAKLASLGSISLKTTGELKGIGITMKGNLYSIQILGASGTLGSILWNNESEVIVEGDGTQHAELYSNKTVDIEATSKYDAKVEAENLRFNIEIPANVANGTVVFKNTDNKAAVVLGKNAVLRSKDDLHLKANTEQKNSNTVGKSGTNKNTSLNSGLGGSVLADLSSSYATVMVAEGAKITAAEGAVSIDANNKLDNYAKVMAGGKVNNNSAIGMNSHMGGNSNALISVDDEANVFSAGKFSVKADNITSLMTIVGDTNGSDDQAIGASMGFVNYNVNTLALISDNDSDKTGSAKDTEEKETVADYGSMLSLALGDDVYTLLSGKKADIVDGSFEALSLAMDATTGGTMYNLTVAGKSAGSAGNDNADNQGMTNNTNTDTSNPQSNPVPDMENTDDADTPDDSQPTPTEDENNKPKKIVAGAGSVSWNKVIGSTAVFLEKGITLHPEKQDGGVLTLSALDSSFIGALSGAAAIATTKEETTFDATLEGAVGINIIAKKTVSEIYEAELKGVNTLTNKAVNNGVQVTAGLALGVEKGKRTGGFGGALGASGSLNFVVSAPMAILKNVMMQDNSANTSVNNIAYDKDVQVAGGVTVEFTKANVGIGGAFSLNQVTNNVIALVEGGQYNVKSFNNYANSKLTQVGSALSLGLNTSELWSVSICGAVAINNIENTIKSAVVGSSIYTVTFDGKSQDGNLVEDSAENPYIKTLADKGFDVNGQNAISMINDGGKTMTVQDTSTADDGTNVTYTANNYNTDNSGNKQISVAVMLDTKFKAGIAVQPGGSVVRSKIKNDFTVDVAYSNIVAKNTLDGIKFGAESDTLQLGVAAGVSAAKNTSKGANLAGSVVIQDLQNNTKVTVQDSSLKADDTSITALTKSKMISVAGAGAGGGNAAVGFTWAHNKIANVTGVYALGTELQSYKNNIGADLTMISTNNSVLTSVAATTAVSLGTYTGSAQGATAFNRGTNDTEAIVDASVDSEDSAVTHRSNLKKVGTVIVKAEDNDKLTTVAGGVGVTTGIVGAGGHYAESDIGKSDKYQSAKAAINNTNISTLDKNSTIALKALDNSAVSTIAAGVGIAVNTGTVSVGNLEGNVVNNKVYKKVETSMSSTTLDIDGVPDGEKGSKDSTLTLDAINKMKLTASADSGNINVGGYVAGGVGVATNYSYVDTIAGIYGRDPQVKSELNAGKISLKADAQNEILNVGISAAGGGSAGKLVTVTGAANAATNKLNNKTKAEITNALIYTNKSVSVTAESLTKLTNIAGAASVAAGASSGVRGSFGTTVSLNNLYDETLARVADSDITAVGENDNGKKKGLYISAKSTHNLKNIAVTAGVAAQAGSGLGVSAGADVINDNIAGSTKAIMERTDTNKGITNLQDTQNVDVLADDSITLNSTAVSAQVSVSVGDIPVALSMGAGVTTEKITRLTEASIAGMNDLRRSNINAHDVNVNADTTQNFKLGNYVTAFALAIPTGTIPTPIGDIPISVAGGVTAGVGTIELKGTTKANIDYANIYGVNTSVLANHNDYTDLTGVAGSLAGGIISMGVGVNTYNMTNNVNTAAEIKHSKILHRDNGTGKDSIKAYNKSTMRNSDVAATVSIGLGAAVGVTTINNTFTGNALAAMVNTVVGNNNSNRADAVEVIAENDADVKHIGVNANVGLAAVGVTNVHNTLNTSTVSEISGGAVYSGDITVNAKETRKLDDTVVGGSLGAAAVNVTKTYNNIGASLQDSYALEGGGSASTTDMQDYINNSYRVQNAVIADVLEKSKNGDVKLFDVNEFKREELLGTETKVYKAPLVSAEKVRGANAIVNSNTVLNGTGIIDIKTNVYNVADAQITAGGLALVKVGVMQNHLGLQDCSNVVISGANITGDTIVIGNDVTGNLRASAVDAGGGAVGVGVTQTDVQRTGGITISLQDSSITATNTIADTTIYVGNTNNVSLYGNVTNVTGGAVAGSALKSVVMDNSKVDINVIGSATGADYNNNLEGKSITLINSVTPQILAKITGVAAGAVTGGGSRVRAEERNTASFTVERTNVNADYFSTGNTVLDVNKGGNEVNSVAADAHVTSIGAVGVAINKSITIADIKADATMNSVRYDGFSDNAKTDVVVINLAESQVSNDIRGLTIGAIAVGSNICENTNTSKANTTITLDNIEDTEVASFNVTSATVDRGTLKSNGDGGGIIGVSPLAVDIDNDINSTSTMSFIGSDKALKTTGDVNIISQHGDYLTVNGDAVQCNIIGGSGTRINNDIVFTDKTILKNVKIDAGGNVYIGAQSQSNLNEDNTRVLETGGGGGFTGATSHANNHLTTNNNVVLDSSTIASDKNILVGGYSDGVYYFAAYCQNAGLAGGNTAFMTNNWSINDKVETKGATSLETRREGGDITFVARENMNGGAKNYVEMTAGVAGGTNSELTSNITRNNSIQIGDGTNLTKINSKQDINVFAGKDENGKLAETALQLQSQVYCGCVMNFSSTPKLDSSIVQHNTITLAANTESVSTRHVNLYADAARESLYEHAGAYKMIGKNTAKSSYVSTTAGGVEDKFSRENSVTINGSVTVGRDNIYKIEIGNIAADLTNAIIVPNEYISLVTSDNNSGLPVYNMNSMAQYIRVTVGDSTVALTGDELQQLGFKTGIMDLAQMTDKQLNEVDTLIANYNKETGDTLLYERLIAERTRLQSLKDSQTSANVSQVAYIEVPDVVASGGNVVVDSDNLLGNGKINARGNAEISIENKTNLTLVTNNITVDEPGGELIYNGVAVDESTLSMRNEAIGQKNISGSYPNFAAINGSKGTSANINIHSDFGKSIANPQGIRYVGDIVNTVPDGTDTSTVLYMNGNGDYTKADGETVIMGYKDVGGARKFVVDHTQVIGLPADLVLDPSDTTGINNAINIYGVKVSSSSGPEHYDGYLPIKSDIYITGNVNSLNGNVNVRNEYDSIVIQGKSVKDAVSVKGKVVTLSAPNGSITQGFTDGIVNIGTDVRKQYESFYNSAVNSLHSTEDCFKTAQGALVTEKMKDGEKSDNAGGWLAGGQIYINASDININGNIQSGYGKYVVDITDKEENKIAAVTTNWRKNGGNTIADNMVIGNAAYKVVEGGSYWSATDQCYQYHVDVYYNPSTGKFLVPDVDANGGKIFLFGRILSTGSGKIMCLDGAYNIDVKNSLNHDLQLGNLIVNDTQGVVSIMNSGSGLMTEIRRSGLSVKNLKTGDTSSSDSHIVKNTDGTYTYNPDNGLAYSWVTGYSAVDYTRYSREFMAKWWGWSSYKEIDSKTLDSWRDGATNKGTFHVGKEGRPEGGFISENVNFGDNVGIKVEHVTKKVSSKSIQEGPPEEWSTGLYGCHKWRRYTWRTETGTKQANSAYVNASNPINIRFIGTSAENATVNITSTATEDNKIILGGSVGNQQVYISGTDHIEKGVIKITNENGSVVQLGGGLYGANIALSAKTGLDGIKVVAGDTVNLDARSTGTGKVDVTVSAAREARGDINLGSFGGRSAVEATLNASANINYKASAFGGIGEVSADRININAANGYVGTAGNNIIVHGGQQATGANTMTASVNVTAKEDIYLNEKEGDLRAGKIYSTDGDLTITVNNGGIVDALPYEEVSSKSNDELIAEWTSLGFFDEKSKAEKTAQLQAVRTKLFEERDGTFATRKAEINTELQKMETDKAAVEQEKTKKLASFDVTINKCEEEITKITESKNNYETNEWAPFWNNYVEQYNTRKTALETERDAVGTSAERIAEINTELGKMAVEKTATEQLHTDKIAVYDALISNRDAEKTSVENSKNNYETNVWTPYWNNYQSQYNTRKTALENERDYAGATDARKAEINKQLEGMPTTYDGWNKDKLIYAISDKIINPTSGVVSSSKDPNLYAKNIILKVKNNAGLNDPNVQVINLNTLGDVDVKGNVIHINDLKALSQADASTVTWNMEDGTATINKKLAIGLRQGVGGTLTVTGVTDSSKVNDYVYLEGRKFHDSTMGSWGQDDINLTKLAALGDVRIFSLGTITPPTGSNISDIISAHNLLISVGAEDSAIAYDIGTSDNPMSFTNITGSISALATGNVYLKSDGDLVVANISAGGRNVSGGGTIYLESVNGSIYGMVEASQPVQGYIRSESGGIITLKAENGSIGSVTDDSKVIRIRNVDNSNPALNTLKFMAGKDIGIEGVSTAITGKEQSPDGILYLGTASIDLRGTASHNITFTVNGTLKMAGSIDLGLNTDTILTLKSNKMLFDSGSSVKAETINLQTVSSFEQAAGSIIEGKNVNLTAGVLLDKFTYGTNMAVDEKELAKAKVVQKYENKIETADPYNRIIGGNANAKLIADNLKVVSNADIDLGSQENRIHNILADAQKSIEIGTGHLGNNTDKVTATITNSKDSGGRVNGDIRIMVYETDSVNKNGLYGKGNFYATGDIALYSEAGALDLHDNGYISAGGMVILMSGDTFNAGNKQIYAGQGLGIIAKKDITSLPTFAVVGSNGFYVESLKGNIYANTDSFAGRIGSKDASGNITYVNGGIEMVAEEGSIIMPDAGGIYARDDVEFRAKKSIINGNGIYSEKGDISIYTLGEESDEGLVTNSNELITLNGSVFLYGNKGVVNNASIVAESLVEGEDGYREDAGYVTILSNTKVTNATTTGATPAKIKAAKGVYMVTGSEGLTNSADIEVIKGDVVLYGYGKYEGEGWELLQGSGGSVNNNGNIFTHEGFVDISSDAGLTNTGNIYTLQGDVDLTAVNNISNTGNVVALDGANREEGNVTIISTHGNIDYAMKETDQGVDIGTGSLVAASQGLLTIMALNDVADTGKVTVSSSLASGRGITITADKDISIAGTWGMTALDGGIAVTSEKGYLDLNGDITAEGTGNVYLNGNGYVQTKGAITVNNGDFIVNSTATDPANPTNGDITISKVDGDDKLIANQGEIFLTADGKISVNTAVSAGKDFTAVAGDNFDVSDSVSVTDGEIGVVAGKDIATNGEITSVNGGVYLLAGGGITNDAAVQSGTKDVIMIALDGNVLNKSSITATKGNVMIGANSEDPLKGNITNGEIAGVTNNITAGQDVILGASGVVTNNHNIYAATRATETDANGNITFQQHGDVVLGTVVIEADADRYEYQTAKSLINTGNIITHEGEIDMVVTEDLTNSGTILVKKQNNVDNGHGNVNLVAGSNMVVSDDVQVDVKGHITMLAGGTLTVNSGGDIKTAEGDVTLTSVGALTNNANISAGIHSTDPDVADTAGNVALVAIGDGGADIINNGSIEATDSVLMAGENVINTNKITSYNDSIYLYANKNLQNATTSGAASAESDVDITAGKRIFISAENDILNTGDITAQTGVVLGRGQVQISGETFTIDDTENLTNYGTITTVNCDMNLSVAKILDNHGSILSANGDVLLEANSNLHNVNGEGIVLAENGNITMVAGNFDATMANGNILTNQGSLGAKGDIVMLALNGGLNNTSTLKADNSVATEGFAITEGQLVMMSAGDLENDKALISQGDVIVQAGGNINNSYVVVSTTGDVEFVSTDGSVTATNDIYALDGNVLLEAGGAEEGHKGVTINGDIYADGGDLQIHAAHGDIINVANTGNAWSSNGGGDVAKGSITLLAEDGGIINTNSMKAEGDITLLSKDGIIVSSDGYGIKNIESTKSGNIIIYATGEAVDGGERDVSTNNGSNVTVNGGFFYNEASLTTANGNVLIMANGYAKKNLNAVTSEDSEKFDIPDTVTLSVYNDNIADILAKGGNVIIAGAGGVANQGDIEVKKGRTGTASNEVVLQEGGNLAIYSDQGSIFLYDLPNSDGETGHRNLLDAENDMLFCAPNGSLYINKDIHSSDGDIVMDFGGVAASVNNKIIADNGNISINADGGIGIKATVSAQEGAVEINAGEDLLVELTNPDEFIVAKDNITLLAGGGVMVTGDISSSDNNVVIGAANGSGIIDGMIITGNISAEKGMVALGSQKGNMDINGSLTGNNITLYTEDKDARIEMDTEITVFEELVLAGNHFNGNRPDGYLDMSRVHGDDYVVSLFGTGRSVGGDYKLDYGANTGLTHFNQIGVDSLEVHTNGPVKIDNIGVGKKADIYSMGTKTNIYGKMQPYDAESEVTYYTSGGGRMLDLHNMYFTRDISESKAVSEIYAKNTKSAVTGGDGMSLDIVSRKLQRGNGILIKDNYGQDVKNNRFSAVEISSYLNSINAINQHNNYFDMGLNFFERYNIIEIPEVIVNSTMFNNVVKDKEIIVVKNNKDDDEYEF